MNDFRFSQFHFSHHAAQLSRAVRELSQESPAMVRDYDFIKQRQKRMVEVPANQMNGTKPDDALVTSLTGVGSLATSLTGRIAAAKAKFAASNSKVDAAFQKLDSAGAAMEQVAGKLEQEADAALSQIGQISNMGQE